MFQQIPKLKYISMMLLFSPNQLNFCKSSNPPNRRYTKAAIAKTIKAINQSYVENQLSWAPAAAWRITGRPGICTGTEDVVVVVVVVVVETAGGVLLTIGMG